PVISPFLPWVCGLDNESIGQPAVMRLRQEAKGASVRARLQAEGHVRTVQGVASGGTGKWRRHRRDIAGRASPRVATKVATSCRPRSATPSPRLTRTPALSVWPSTTAGAA